MGEERRLVERGYDAIAERYAREVLGGRGPDSYYRRFLDRVLAMVPPGGRVLDLGCGAGIVTVELARRARTIGLDVSGGQLALARRTAPGAAFVRADIAEVAFAPASFDVVAAFWSLIHVRRDRHAEVLGRIRTWLRPGGLLVGTLGSGDNPDERQADFFGAPMYWSHFDAEVNRRLLEEAGFAPVEAEVREDADERHLWVVATAPA